MRKRALLALLLLLSAVLSSTVLSATILPAKGSTKNWTVDDDGSADFHTIQEAINAASNGDTVLVFAGVYYEHVVINKTLSLKSLESAVIDASTDSGNKVTPTIARWNGITIISDNTIVSGFLIRNADNYGINIRANYCTIQNNLCQDCSLGGISLYGEIEGYTDIVYNQPQNNIIQDNIVRNCFSGIYAKNAHNNNIIQNQFDSNKYAGVYMFGYSSNNTIDSNIISQSTHTWEGAGGNGIALGTGANHNLITNNTISNNSEVGCKIDLLGLGYPYPYSNIVCGNRFSGNPIQAYDSGTENLWDNGYSGGNFWSDYNGTDANNDGIGDSPYVIAVDSVDRYPLMAPFTPVPTPTPSPTPTPTPVPTQTPTPTPNQTQTPTATPNQPPSPTSVPESFFNVKSNSTVIDLFFNSTSSELSFTVIGPSGTAGYVEVTIAKNLLSNVQNIKVYFDGNQLNVPITEDADSWLLSFTYMHSMHQVMISLATSEAEEVFLSYDLILITVAIVLAAAVISVSLLLYLKKYKH